MYETHFEKENENKKLKEARNVKLKEISLNSTETKEVDRFFARYYALLCNFPRGRDTFGQYAWPYLRFHRVYRK